MMEKITDIELYMALLNIRQYCKQQIQCHTCAMFDGGCLINRDNKTPAEWKLREPLSRWIVFDD